MSETLIQCVLVLYKITVNESRTFQSLSKCCLEETTLGERLSILVFDNSPTVHPPVIDDGLFQKIEYYHDAYNGGLTAAYNYALKTARDNDIGWLLLLDQDTLLEVDLFLALFREIDARLPSSVCALVPKLLQNGSIISPQEIGMIWNKSISPQFSGLSSRLLTAFNSAACLKVQAIDEIGGFPKEYWLDYLDHITFHRLQAANGRILVLDVTLQHHLSLLNIEEEMSVERYANVLAAEWRFIRETKSKGGTLVHRIRLLKRAVSLLMKLHNHSYSLQTFRSILK